MPNGVAHTKIWVSIRKRAVSCRVPKRRKEAAPVVAPSVIEVDPPCWWSPCTTTEFEDVRGPSWSNGGRRLEEDAAEQECGVVVDAAAEDERDTLHASQESSTPASGRISFSLSGELGPSRGRMPPEDGGW